jgi:hypothetical protein
MGMARVDAAVLLGEPQGREGWADLGGVSCIASGKVPLQGRHQGGEGQGGWGSGLVSTSESQAISRLGGRMVVELETDAIPLASYSGR